MSRKIAFVFPGQGSQSVGMLAQLAASQPVVKETFSAASDVLGYGLWKLVQEGPEDKLMATERTQPAMLVTGVAVWRTWQNCGGVLPDVMAGHSLGEYSALVAAGALNFQDAVALVAERGRRMQEATPNGVGAIAAILGLEDERVIRICTEAAQGEVVSAVNFNAPAQVVVAGHRSAVNRALSLAKEAGAKRSVLLPMSVPAHSALMQAAVGAVEKRLAAIEFFAPSVPVVHNFDLSRRRDPDALREVLVRHLCSPVRWADTISMMADEGVDLIIECGPGKVLSALTRRIERRIEPLPIFDDLTLETALERTESTDVDMAQSMGFERAVRVSGG